MDSLFEFYEKYLPNGAIASMEWSRSGLQKFNLVGGEKAKLNLINILGNIGRFTFSVTYPEGVSEESKLKVRELMFTYELLDNGDIKFDVGEFIIHGMASLVDDKLVLKSDVEQPKGFIGITTLWTIVSSVHTIWVLTHPVVDIALGNELSLKTYCVDDVITIDFDKGITVKILTLMRFNLAIKQLTFTRDKVVTKFTGTMFAKQYTLDIKR